MKNKKKKFFRSPWLIGITATATGSIIAELFSKFKILTAIFNLLVEIINLIVKFFSISISIPLWIFILLLIPSIIIIILIIGFLIEKKANLPKFFDYTQDEFDGIAWKWSWLFDKFFSKKWDIEDLTPFCPKCDCQLLSASPSGFRCPNCHFENRVYHKSDDELNVIISQRARKLISQSQNQG